MSSFEEWIQLYGPPEIPKSDNRGDFKSTTLFFFSEAIGAFIPTSTITDGILGGDGPPQGGYLEDTGTLPI